jgi:hypothetical protein
MSWIQENKVAASIIGATVVVCGVLYYMGNSANSDADAARKKERGLVNNINKLQSATPYPSKENEQMLAENLANFAADTKKFQEKMLTFRPEEMPPISANEFNGVVSKYINKLSVYYKSKDIELPEKGKSYFGMEMYEKKMAPEQATRYLNYNRKALEWLFITLADSGIEKLNNVYRDPKAEELAKPKPSVGPPTGGRAALPAAVTSVYDGLPIEITFTGTEASLEKFLTEVVAGEEYFFAIDYLKIRNEEQVPVTISKATFAPTAEATPTEKKADAGPFGGLDFGGEAGPSFGEFGPEVEKDKEIIKQVIGDEKITVFIRLELVHFKEASDITIPRLVEEESANKSPVKTPVR